jgi:nitrogen regulatory protein P-II 2
MDTTKLTLVTIIAEQVLETRVIELAKHEGATGFTSTPCRGEGTRGLRTGAEEGGNVRLELLVREAVGDAIVARLAEDWFRSYGVVAWLQEVRVVRGEKYL